MVFITTGQRIATENFADGVIYKVTFVDTTISYMMCVGIGQDFVMLQGPNPSLFCLTMSSASRVSTIDIHDPTPPEPPTPIENALQYQTGEPPFTFTTTESSLFSWYIEGPCGVKTANLFNIATATIGYFVRAGNSSESKPIGNIERNQDYNVSDYIEVEPDTTYSIKYTAYNNVTGAGLVFYSDNSGSTISGIPLINQSLTFTFTTPINCNYVRFSYLNTRGDNEMFNLGQPKDYEPYGLYKISILSNDNAETIYLDEALAEGERLYSVNTDTVIATDIGENTLSVTPTPPEMQIVYGIYAEA